MEINLANLLLLPDIKQAIFDGDLILLIDVNQGMFWFYFLLFRSQDIVVGIMTGLGADWSRGWFPAWAWNIAVLQQCQDWLCGPSLLLLKWYKGLSSWGVKLTTQLRQVPRLRMIVDTSVHLDVCMLCTGRNLPFYHVMYQHYARHVMFVTC